MPSLYWVDAVVEDLRRIEAFSVRDADDLRAFLQALEESDDLIDRLSSWHYQHQHADPRFDCMAIASLQRRGYNVYRLKALDLEWTRRRYRIIYAYDVEYDDFIVLAIARRLTNDTPADQRAQCYGYEPDHKITRRICNEYEQLGLPVRQ